MLALVLQNPPAVLWRNTASFFSVTKELPIIVCFPLVSLIPPIQLAASLWSTYTLRCLFCYKQTKIPNAFLMMLPVKQYCSLYSVPDLSQSPPSAGPGSFRRNQRFHEIGVNFHLHMSLKLVQNPKEFSRLNSLILSLNLM